MRRLSIPTLITFAAATFACSSEDGATDDEPTVIGDTTRADTTGSTKVEERADLDLAPPEQGFQIETLGTTIAPGEDIEFCEVVQLPGDPSDVYWVERTEVQMTQFSHHLIINAIDPESAVNDELEVGSITECSGAMELVGFDGLNMIAGSQTTYDDATYHDGVGLRMYGGQYLMFDYHYLNTSNEDAQAKHRFNVYTTDESEIDHLLQAGAFVNLTINTPPGASESFVGECQYTEDVTVGALLRHTHAKGTNFDVWFSGGTRDGEHIWTSTDYELDTEYAFEEPLLMPAGTGFRFQCDFENTTDDALTFGLKATDEMCILFTGWWHPTELEPPSRQFCMMTSIDDDGVARRGEITQEMIDQFRQQSGM